MSGRRLSGLVGAVALASTLFVAPLTAHAQTSDDEGEVRPAPEPVPGQYIVQLREVDSEDVGAVAGDLASEHDGEVIQTYEHALEGFAVEMSEEDALELSKDPRVSRVTEDGEVHALETQAAPTWGLDRIDQRDLPLNSAYSYDATGAGVTAYILDTGIRTSHQDFGGRASVGIDTIGGGQNGQDCSGHGTHVAGTVGGATYGVAKQASLVAVRVLDCQGNGTWSSVIAGIDWVTANHVAPAVANMSLGGGVYEPVNAAVRNSIASGVTYAVAAGNESGDACTRTPASTAEAITVGSTTSTDARSSFSNFGTCVDLFGPGSSITSGWHTSDTATNTISGTSMATPHVAGAAARYLEENPSALPSAVAGAITGTATLNHVTNAGTGSPNRLLFAEADPPPPGLTVVLDSIPNSAQDFTFTRCDAASNCAPFTLDDDADGALPRSASFDDLPLGTWTITQSAPDGHQLTSLACDTGETTDLGLRRATIDLTTAERVTCTFTNRPLPPANDPFASPQVLAGPSGSASGSNVSATKEPGEPNHHSAGGRSVWFSWTAPVTGTATFDTAGSGFDTLLAAYTGSSLGALGQVAADDDSGPGVQSRIQFPATAGTTYRIAVDGYQGAQGSSVLNWTSPAPAPALSITKATTTPAVDAGQPAAFSIEVANTGNAALTGVTVADDAAPGCAQTIGDLPLGATRTLTCTEPTTSADVGTLANTATADSDQTAPVISNTVQVDVRKVVLFDRSARTVSGSYVPVVGDFNGDRFADVLWYRAGRGADYLWWGNGAGGFTSRSITISGTYVPIAGDFNGDAVDDIFWYRAGSGADSLWLGNGAGGFAGRSMTVSGTYAPTAGDFNGDGVDDIVWYSTTGADSLWTFNRSARPTGRSLSIGPGLRPFAGDFDGGGVDDLFLYAPGTAADVVWYFDTAGNPAGQAPFDVDGTYTPVPGDYDGNGIDDVLWYGSGTSPDDLWLDDGTGDGFSEQAIDIAGTYRIGAGRFTDDPRTDLFLYGPNSAADALWTARLP